MKQTGIILFILTAISTLGQGTKTTDYFEKIKSYDLSDLWTLDKFEIDNDTTTVKRSEPLGFIGENYQRFYIHFISVIKNSDDRSQYFVYGKTRVKDNICKFQGTLRITSAQTYDDGDVPNLKQGYVTGQYNFSEDPSQKGAGILKGTFRTDFYIDGKGKLKYDAINFVADGFANNQFEGTWTSYATAVKKKCNWGDYRIPDSNELDYGAGEFGPGEKFEQYGWLTFMAARHITNKMDNKKAITIENEKWWTRD